MTNLERLRLSTALAHVVPGATLHLHCHSGQEVNVGAHPTADLDACALRKVVIASASPEVPDYSELVRDIKVCGSLQHMGGGVHRRVVGEVEQRWIATLLTPATVADLLDDCGPNGIPHDAMHACLKPDSELAVTCVAITANDPDVRPHARRGRRSGDVCVPRRGTPPVHSSGCSRRRPPRRAGRADASRRGDRTMSRSTVRSVLVAAALVLTAAACGSDDSRAATDPPVPRRPRPNRPTRTRSRTLSPTPNRPTRTRSPTPHRPTPPSRRRSPLPSPPPSPSPSRTSSARRRSRPSPSGSCRSATTSTTSCSRSA